MRTVKWTKLALVVVVPALALLFLGQSVRPPAAEAKPTTIITINWALCVSLDTTIDWNGNGHVDDGDSTVAFFDCHDSLNNQGSFDNMIGALRNIPDAPLGHRQEAVLASPPTPEDFTAPGKDANGFQLTPMDSDAGQLHQLDGMMWFIAFVTNDDPVAFYADNGVFQNGKSSIACGPGAPNADFDFTDPDCDKDSSTKGDGVVTALLVANDSDRGPATVRVRQDHVEMEEPYTVVGEPSQIEFSAPKSTIQTGAPLCELFSDTSSYLATLGAPEKTPVSSKVMDSDGTPVTGAMVVYDIISDNNKIARFALPTKDTQRQESVVPTLSTALGVSSPDVLCGNTDTGTITVRASISSTANGVGLDPQARERHAELEVKVQGPPTNMVLSAASSSLVCDGTAASTVSATLTDAAGNPAVDGNVVRFDVKALGTVSPIEAKSAGGVATTAVTPLTDIARGVTVNATLLRPQLDEGDADDTAADPVEDADDSEVLVPSDVLNAFLVECSTTAPQPAPGTAPSGSIGPNISPPSTGDGGYLSGE
jgi:Invasin, domain 3